MTRAIHGMFFLSGVGALAFETVWFNQAALVVGNSVWSAALVVGAFMAGLALGNAAAIVLARRWTNLVAGYAGIEVLAAASGAALVLAFPHLPALLAPLLASFLDDALVLNPARLGIAFVLMVIPATALGATLPLLAKPLSALTGSYGFALGRLYGLNTLGAVAGTLLAELVLIPALGLTGTGLAAAGCNLGAAVLPSRVRGAARAREAASVPAPSGRLRLLAAAFLAGALLLALEVTWFRFLLLFLDGTALVFAVMLAVVLAGIGLGGLVAARASRRRELTPLAARAAAGAAAVLVVACYGAFGWVAQVRSPVLLALFLMAPAALASGFLFTALGARLRSRMDDAGAATGALTLANTLGAMLGSLAAAFVLLPVLGMERSFFLLALAYLAVALVIPAEGPRLRRFAPALAAALAAALFPFGHMADTYYRDVEKRHGAALVAAREGIAQTTFYLRHDFLGEPLYHRLATNSYSMASTAVGVQRYMTLFAWLPAALHPRIESALLLCFGVGTTASALAELPEMKTIDVVDVSRDILEMSDVVFPDKTAHPLRDARVSVHVEDARFYLQLTQKRYDLITGEPPPPKMAGVAALYTREYFELVRSRLNPGGIATYWLPAYLLQEDEAMSIIGAFCGAFDDCSLWSGLNRDWILLGSRGGVAPVSEAQFSRLWQRRSTREELDRLGIDSPAQLAAQFMADAGALRGLVKSVPPLTDDRPRRIRPALRAEPATPRYAFLMDAERGRERLLASKWAAVLPEDVLKRSADGFRRRAMLTAALNPAMRGADYNYWGDIAALVRDTELVELPRWLLGSGAQAAEIAARRGDRDPVAAEHLAIDAVAHRRPPAAAIEKGRFQAMTPRGQLVTAFHDCLSGDAARAWTLLGWMREQGRANLDPEFLAWAKRECRA